MRSPHLHFCGRLLGSHPYFSANLSRNSAFVKQTLNPSSGNALSQLDEHFSDANFNEYSPFSERLHTSTNFYKLFWFLVVYNILISAQLVAF